MGSASVWSLNFKDLLPGFCLGEKRLGLGRGCPSRRHRAGRGCEDAASGSAAGGWSDKGEAEKRAASSAGPLCLLRLSIQTGMLIQVFLFTPLLPIFNRPYPWEVSDCWILRQPLRAPRSFLLKVRWWWQKTWLEFRYSSEPVKRMWSKEWSLP